MIFQQLESIMGTERLLEQMPAQLHNSWNNQINALELRNLKEQMERNV